MYPRNSTIRPTTDKLRSAIFSILGDITAKNVLDLCCGTGSFGIEAISRGAGSVVFLDINTTGVSQNISLIKDADFRIVKGDIYKKLPVLKGENFDIIFFDPPYQKIDINLIFQLIYENDLLSNNGILIVEESKKIVLTDNSYFTASDKRIYGDTTVIFYKGK